MSKIYHEPSTLNEWTLEMNLNHEILSMFNDFYLGNYPYYLRRVIFDLPLLSPLNPFRKKGYAYKLTPREEGAGGGWDGKIIIPKGMGRDSRIIFIQYKRGYHSDGNSESQSIFNKNHRDPNKHVEFTFNSDNNKNQHQYLKNLVDDLASKGNSDQIVMYGFPRITTKEQFEELGGNLLLYTTFLTVAQMDNEASKAHVNLYDNNEHKFRTCYVDRNRREICSTPFELHEEDVSIDVLYEIMALKIGSFWNNGFEKTRYIDRIKDELKLMVADYLKINPFEQAETNLENLKDLYFRGYLDYFKDIDKKRTQAERELFFSESEINYFAKNRSILFEKLTSFIDKFDYKKIDLNTEIPKIFTQPFTNEISINIQTWETDATLSYIIL